MIKLGWTTWGGKILPFVKTSIQFGFFIWKKWITGDFQVFVLANSFAYHCKSAFDRNSSLCRLLFHILTYNLEVLGQKPVIFRGSESGPSPVKSVRALVILSTQEVLHPLTSPSIYVGFCIKANGKSVWEHLHHTQSCCGLPSLSYELLRSMEQWGEALRQRRAGNWFLHISSPRLWQSSNTEYGAQKVSAACFQIGPAGPTQHR